jgi:hypothetical protein
VEAFQYDKKLDRFCSGFVFELKKTPKHSDLILKNFGTD